MESSKLNQSWSESSINIGLSIYLRYRIFPSFVFVFQQYILHLTLGKNFRSYFIQIRSLLRTFQRKKTIVLQLLCKVTIC